MTTRMEEKRRDKVGRESLKLLNDVRDARARCERAVRVTSYGWLVEDETTDRRNVLAQALNALREKERENKVLSDALDATRKAATQSEMETKRRSSSCRWWISWIDWRLVIPA
jgi:hypothetical protein